MKCLIQAQKGISSNGTTGYCTACGVEGGLSARGGPRKWQGHAWGKTDWELGYSKQWPETRPL
eukprot:909292-Karenia_brevis.AAC.1